jgi:purine-binding chemotaxis protein CheW
VTESKLLCTFYLADRLLGIEVERVQEILRHQEMTRIPLASDEVAGLINLRGEIVPAIDLRRCFGLAPRGGEALPTNVIIRTEDGAVSLLVDEIGDVVEVKEDAWEAPPENLGGTMRQLIRGIYKLDGGFSWCWRPRRRSSGPRLRSPERANASEGREGIFA